MTLVADKNGPDGRAVVTGTVPLVWHKTILVTLLFSCSRLLSAAQVDNAPTLRPYASIRYGNYFFLESEALPDVELKTPAQEQTPAATVGVDLAAHLGLELALDYTKTNLLEQNGNKAGDYSTTTLLGQLRFRYPVYSGQLVWYALLGGGAGLGEFSGREDFSFQGGGDGWAPLGIVGLGAEYFVAENIALGLESKYLFGFHPQIRLGDERPAVDRRFGRGLCGDAGVL